MGGKLISRRTVLTMGGSLALAAGLKGRVAAQGGAPAGRVIDVHHHYFAPTFLVKRKEQITESTMPPIR